MDTLTKDARSERMRLIRERDTRPELQVRLILKSLGIRFQANYKKLPGNPDLVFVKRRKVIFVHGCFWHRHSAKTCRLARLPKSRHAFWLRKLESNRLRDARTRRLLHNVGWKVLVIWECQLSRMDRVARRVARFVEEDR